MRDTKQLSAALLSLRRMNVRGVGNSRRSPRRIACALLVLIAAVCGILALLAESAKPARYASILPAVQLAITNPMGFAKSHVTGGIGAVLLVDPASGLPEIHNVLAGSPAERAGLRAGDLIVEVDGVTTRGRTLAQDVERIRGIASISVGLTIQRAGSTNLNCVIHRSSWNGLGIPQ